MSTASLEEWCQQLQRQTISLGETGSLQNSWQSSSTSTSSPEKKWRTTNKDYSTCSGVSHTRERKRLIQMSELLLMQQYLSRVNWCNINYSIDVGIVDNILEYRQLNFIRSVIADAVDHLAANTEEDLVWSFPKSHYKFTAHEDWVCVSNGITCVTVPWLGLLAFEDSLVGLTSVICLTVLDDDLTQRHQIIDVLKAIHAGLQSCILLGERVYDVLKHWHAVVVGRIIENEPEGYTNALLESIHPSIPECPLKDLIDVPLLTKEAKILAMEVSGMAKCFTYPVVNLDKAAETVINTAGKYRAPYKAGQHATWMFRKIFIREFVRERRTWLKTTVIGPLNAVVAQARSNGTWGELSGEWGPDMFRNIRLDENLDFDWHLDTTDLLSDKSIAPPLSSWAQEFDTRYSWLRYGDMPYKGPPAQKRLIIKHLITPVVDTRESIMRLCAGPTDNQVTVMCPRKELSRTVPIFTKLTRCKTLPRPREYMRRFQIMAALHAFREVMDLREVMQVLQRNGRQRRTFCQRLDPMTYYSDVEFLARFRLSKEF
ncbi:hypothetical protein GWK47_027315 [Chionoecetes opilio]|uniref:RdRp catalytic domain-containing protein n=1 Tax=Chionoecetes opilio TaxID=41210 RepID=A0A8J8WDK7_CHIOP|nr:hypothetical protein GWK47_027315 [Chionoecetes opilio]